MKSALFVLIVLCGLAACFAVPVSVIPGSHGVNATKVAEYDEEMGWKMVHYAGAAYCLSYLNRWNCGPHCDYNSFTLQSNFYDVSHDAFGYVGVDQNTRNVIIAFKGSSTLRNWMDNLKISQVERYEGIEDAMVHKGFLEAYQSIEAKMYSALDGIWGPKRIIVVGHSLGGALATLAAVDLHQRGYFVEALYTFGCPRVGNYEFTQYMSSWTQAWRIVNKGDIVVSLPPAGMNFHHFPTEIWYDTDDSYYVCDNSGEDPSCYNSLPVISLSVVDHSYYYGIAVSGCD
eukprot:TRINITY_DN1144_c0_g1::TRINITY_DN1144_c0_g1_i1::g.17216::m.17216 TRINITY_DN1144_c0_g1::TRINITY_DN1144_c0_g1_i1::g.17216  ORF type:complete len:287 (+),score=77.73,sp/P19515/LIP_RHIMI/32.71/2e-30,Lipase_3/PF01764.20/1.5e-32,DUF2974/PF11187.3/5.9e-06,Abhydrolase_6/PF12697.2/2.1e-05,PGAP1/PF07819.8/3.6e-05,Abhydrolase_5/PF12695.2/3.5e-05,Thioesterase/PF00975.15/0.00011,Abhydrolase_3/PF07859.8/0.0046,AXE1/PF05448.7/0.015,Abhydrolase_1/PF00561.15/0.015,Abhydrolase_8/PF06259.7/36,Abhydrolase_8/PF06259.